MTEPSKSEFKRLTIHAFEDLAYKKPLEKLKFEVDVNPNELTFTYENVFETNQPPGTSSSPTKWVKTKPGDLTLALFLDGTGANGRGTDVQKKIDDFMATTGYSSESHRPVFLLVAWGTVPVKRCVLKSLSVVYKLFTPGGTPLRAVLTATFLGNLDDVLRTAKEGKQSADLTKTRRVAAGQTLPALCNEVYGDPRLYLRVAAANGLSSFRELELGSEIYFPPLANG